MLPTDSKAASKLAGHHDNKLKSRAAMPKGEPLALRHALEVRHESFKSSKFVEMLREYHVAMVVADTAGKWPFMEDVTCDFVYVRLHGDEKLYVSGYTPSTLKAWAAKVRSWQEGSSPRDSALHASRLPAAKSGRDVNVYFDNDVKVRAPYDAMALAELLGVASQTAS